MKEKYLEDLKEIKSIMNRSSRFISLSGWSGVVAGLIACAGAYAIHDHLLTNLDFLSYQPVVISNKDLTDLITIGLTTIICTLVAVIWLTTKETKKRNEKIWDAQTQRLLINLFIPLLTGGLLILMLLSKGMAGLAFPLSLIFYGLALINASKYTLNEIRSLGLLETLLGLVAVYFIEQSFWIWVGGFGLLHIKYGIYMQWKLSRERSA